MTKPAVEPPTDGNEAIERSERRTARLGGRAIRSDQSMVQIQVSDLSYEGCGIETPVALTPGETITLSVLKRGVIEAEVRWFEDGRAGLVFSPEGKEEEKKRHRERQSQRVALTAAVTVRRPGQIGFPVRVFDASPHGCKFEFVEQPAIGEMVRVKFDGLDSLNARTCWVEGTQAGVEFERPIHPAVFDLLVARSAGQPSGA